MDRWYDAGIAMTPRGVISPTHKAIPKYYADLQALRAQRVFNEMSLRSPFQALLSETAKLHGWTLITELSAKTATGRVQPDGTLHDSNRYPRGYWEAKDTMDDLDIEIGKKSARGYKLTNTIFEDTQTAVLFQNKQEVRRYQLGNPKELAALLNQFFSYKEPNIEGFEKAVEEFKEAVPELARGLVEKIRQAHRDNPPFIAAFDKFFDLCKTALNPNVRVEAVDEMLVQHLLTERLFRTVFENPDFVKRNAIAAEVEKVIEALVSPSFNRTEFLKRLGRFYVAIEGASKNLEFGEKQKFLNTVYDRFFQGYSVKVADTHGIVYTPQEIVNFMCARVAEVLEKEFGKSLSSKDVYIIDPCTGNFVVNLLRRMPKRDLPRMYREQLFANEVMLLPYYIAALNIEHAYYELTGVYEPFDGLCFVDTLELMEAQQPGLSNLYVTEKNAERVERQKKAEITVVIGNPPYNMNQQNENDNNKNRKYPVIDGRIRVTYARDSKATNKASAFDPYMKFFRWATDRLGGRDGIVCFVTNNKFVRGKASDGSRKNLAKDFTNIFHFDFKGDASTTGERRRREGGNIFYDQIKVGVGITLLVRRAGQSSKSFCYNIVPEYWRADAKLQYLASLRDKSVVQWRELSLDSDGDWSLPDSADIPAANQDYLSYIPIASKEGKEKKSSFAEVIFRTYSRGIETCRDEWAYDFDNHSLAEKIERLVENYNAELDRWRRAGKPDDVDNFVSYDPARIKWCSRLKEAFSREVEAEFKSERIRTSVYRPFVRESVYVDAILTHRRGIFPEALPNTLAEQENRVLWIKTGTNWPMFALVSNHIVDVLPQSGSQCFPFYIYDEDGSNRRENITNWALEHFRKHYADKKITKWNIFYYVYGLLHHPEYRLKYAENLKRELPRIPLAKDFWGFSKAGKELARLHIEYETRKPYNLKFIETPGKPLSYLVEDKMRLAKDHRSLKVNDSLTLSGIPPEAFEYRLGNRSALEWVIDQYQVTEDKKSGIRSDPNRADAPEYIVRLIGRVIRVSLETVRIVNSLPPL
ncbi:MAG: N-6 DNA methylase [Acidobacteria bacterium]|nr:N-6 DNA methylase [Acidobacteriota bacterium]